MIRPILKPCSWTPLCPGWEAPELCCSWLWSDFLGLSFLGQEILLRVSRKQWGWGWRAAGMDSEGFSSWRGDWESVLVGYFKKANLVSVDVLLICRLKHLRLQSSAHLLGSQSCLTLWKLLDWAAHCSARLVPGWNASPWEKRLRNPFGQKAQQTTSAKQFSIAPGFLLIAS